MRPHTVLAGGTDFYPARVGRAIDEDVLDIGGIDVLRGITAGPTGWRLGATTTWSELLEADLPPLFDGLKQAAREVGGRQIQNAGTLAGNICNASPAADTAPSLLVYGATVVAAGPEGTRRIPIDDFFVRSGVTTLGPGELVTAIELPRPDVRRGSVHVRRTRRRGHDLASVTLTCAVSADGTARIAYGSLGPRPVLVTDESGLLADPSAADLAKMQLLETLFVDASPSARSMRASPEYRLAMLHVLGLRAVATAIERLAGGGVPR